MSHNRWLAPDELMHHGVPRQEWGKRNGPPYPLYRQERFRTIGPDGKPITSKVAYKKAQKNVRAANRAERKANPNGTPQDKEERNSFGAQVKRKYRQYKRDQKTKEAERERKEAEAEERRKRGEEAWDEAAKRFNESDISSEERKKILQGIERSRMGGYKDDGYDEFVHPTWGARINRGIEAEILNKAIDKHEADKKAARDAAKEHGTAEEVMKYRDTFSKDEWNEIAGRLEAEARVKRLLDRPLDSASNNQNQNKSSEYSDSGSLSGLDRKTKKIADKGDAREVYKNRTKFTPEQLQTISRRLQAEETIAKYADNQLLFKSDALRNLESLARYAQTAGNIATGVGTIVKAFGGSGKGQQNNGGQQNPNDSIAAKAKLVAQIQDTANKVSKKAKKKAKQYENQSKQYK